MIEFDERKPRVRAFAPGRTELAGNHTDHQGGRVIAATLDCGVEMMVQANGTDIARVESEGFPLVEVDLTDVSPREDERGSTAALVRGVVAGLRAAGMPVGGFDARVRSDIPAGGGLSSSAAFELALARALELLFQGDDARATAGGSAHAPEEGKSLSAASVEAKLSELSGEPSTTSAPTLASSGESPTMPAPTLASPGEPPTTPAPALASSAVSVFQPLPPVQLARIGQAAERDWFGKPCGLMDQLSIALGGINEMDFASDDVHFETIPFDFEHAGYALLLVDTHCDHSRYTNEYAQVARDMDDVARFFGTDRLSRVPEQEFLSRLGDVRRDLGDMPALRALHYYHEMALVDNRAEALRENDVAAFLEATRRSGASSAQYLQNVGVADRLEQPAMVVLAVADHAAGPRGAVRIHGGGFGGTVQAFVPTDDADAFAIALDSQFGAGSCKRCRVTERGAYAEWVS